MLDKRHLLLTLEAPLMTIGRASIDNFRPTGRFPHKSMLAGLLSNALGWERTDAELSQRLQERLVFAVRIDREQSDLMTDFQTAKLQYGEKGWTTRGKPEGRTGARASYNAPQLRYIEYLVDCEFTIALRLDPDYELPTIRDIAKALAKPARPLFLGRKSCIPSSNILRGDADSPTALGALLSVDSEADGQSTLMWTDGEGVEHIRPTRTYGVSDLRDWATTYHVGESEWCEWNANDQ